MLGLLLKDFALFKSQKRFFLVIAICAIIIGTTLQDFSLMIGYFTFIIPSFALTTISYDEYENGNQFLFTLPINKKTYVIEKYLFTLILTISSSIFSIIIALVMKIWIKDIEIIEILIVSFSIILVVFLFNSIMLPIQIRFGAEKGRMVMISLIGLVIGLIFILTTLFSKYEISLTVITDYLMMLNPYVCICIILILISIIVLISIKISIIFLTKKEL